MGRTQKLYKAVHAGYGILEFPEGHDRLYALHSSGEADHGAGSGSVLEPGYQGHQSDQDAVLHTIPVWRQCCDRDPVEADVSGKWPGKFVFAGDVAANHILSRRHEVCVKDDLYEAAEIDGAGKIRIFFTITIPQITSIIFFNLIMQIIQALQNFTSAFVITDGGPMKSTYVLGMKLYKEGFSYFKMGYASSISWVVFTIILVVSLVLFRSSSAWVYYEDQGDF